MKEGNVKMKLVDKIRSMIVSTMFYVPAYIYSFTLGARVGVYIAIRMFKFTMAYDTNELEKLVFNRVADIVIRKMVDDGIFMKKAEIYKLIDEEINKEIYGI